MSAIAHIIDLVASHLATIALFALVAFTCWCVCRHPDWKPYRVGLVLIYLTLCAIMSFIGWQFLHVQEGQTVEQIVQTSGLPWMVLLVSVGPILRYRFLPRQTAAPS